MGLQHDQGGPFGVREVATRLGVSRFTVYDLIKRGELPAYRVGNRLRVDPPVLAAYKRAAATTRNTARLDDLAMVAPDDAASHWLDIVAEDGRARPLTEQALRAVGPTTVTATRLGLHSFTQHRYTGVLLHALLVSQGVVRAVEAWRPSLSRYVLAVGADGHMVALTLGEIDPAYSNVPVLVAWERDGAALSAGEAPLLLVVPSDHRGGRYVRELVQLVVRDGAEARTTHQHALWTGQISVNGPR